MDIEWQVMRDWKHEKTVKAYYMFKNMFEEQNLPEEFLWKHHIRGNYIFWRLLFL